MIYRGSVVGRDRRRLLFSVIWRMFGQRADDERSGEALLLKKPVQSAQMGSVTYRAVESLRQRARQNYGFIHIGERCVNGFARHLVVNSSRNDFLGDAPAAPRCKPDGGSGVCEGHTPVVDRTFSAQALQRSVDCRRGELALAEALAELHL